MIYRIDPSGYSGDCRASNQNGISVAWPFARVNRIDLPERPMSSERFSFERFLSSIADMSIPEIQVATQREIAEAELMTRSRKHRESAARYAAKLKEFAFFLGHGIRPSSASKSDFASYRPVCENLVAKGQFKPSILEFF